MNAILLRRLAVNLTVAAVASAGCLGLLELAARLLHHPEPMRRVYDPFAYRIPQPNLVDRFTTGAGEELTIRLNEEGMRGPSVTEPVATGTLTVVFLGGSTTENYGYALEDTFPALVGKRLQEELGRPIRVFNAGMSAATTSTSLARLQHQVLDLKPDLVVVMHAINDLLGGFHPGFRGDGRHLVRPPTASWQPRSYLYDWLRSFAPHRRRGPLRHREERHIDDFSTFPALHVFERNLVSMAAIASAHHLPILFLTQGSMYQGATESDRERMYMTDSLVGQGTTPPDLESLTAGMRAFNHVVLHLEKGKGVRVFDLAATLPHSWEVFVDDCHFTKEGNRRVAEALDPVVRSMLQEQVRGDLDPAQQGGSQQISTQRGE